MQPFYFIAQKGKTYSNMHSHVGQEFIYVIEGTMIYTVGNDSHMLAPGDSLYFDSIENHTYTLITDEVKYISVFCSDSKA